MQIAMRKRATQPGTCICIFMVFTLTLGSYYLWIMDILVQAEWRIAKPSCSSSILYSINSIAYNHHTDIYPHILFIPGFGWYFLQRPETGKNFLLHAELRGGGYSHRICSSLIPGRYGVRPVSRGGYSSMERIHSSAGSWPGKSSLV